jgi:hypothetical protein
MLPHTISHLLAPSRAANSDPLMQGTMRLTAGAEAVAFPKKMREDRRRGG